MKLVLIDDSELIRNQLLRLISGQPGIEVVGTADNENDAVALILDRRPDAVILDLALNPGSGLRVLEQIRTAGSKARVLVLTNNTEEAVRAACQRHGISGFHDKYREVRACLDQLFSWLPSASSHLDLDPHAQSRLRAGFRGWRALVVDDDALNREVMAALVEDAGLRVDVAANGDEAVELARQHDYAVILMDIWMQPVDGLTTTRLIRALDGHKLTPIVAVTAAAFSEDRKRCLDTGMNAFVAKPFPPSLLFGTLLQVLEPARLMGPA